MTQQATMCSPEDREFCPVGSIYDSITNMHCECWYDGLQCCRCYDSAMTQDEMEEEGMEV